MVTVGTLPPLPFWVTFDVLFWSMSAIAVIASNSLSRQVGTTIPKILQFMVETVRFITNPVILSRPSGTAVAGGSGAFNASTSCCKSKPKPANEGAHSTSPWWKMLRLGAVELSFQIKALNLFLNSESIHSWQKYKGGVTWWATLQDVPCKVVAHSKLIWKLKAESYQVAPLFEWTSNSRFGRDNGQITDTWHCSQALPSCRLVKKHQKTLRPQQQLQPPFQVRQS